MEETFTFDITKIFLAMTIFFFHDEKSMLHAFTCREQSTVVILHLQSLCAIENHTFKVNTTNVSQFLTNVVNFGIMGMKVNMYFTIC